MKLGRLLAMAKGRVKQQWDHTASILCFLASPYRDPKKQKKPFSPMQFHPFEMDHSSAVEITDIGILKKIFVNGKA